MAFAQVHIDASSFGRAAAELSAAGKASPDAMRRAINHTGDKALTGMRRVLVIQTGLKAKTIRKAVTSTKASSKGGGAYVIKSRGGDVRLKFFGAKETTAGVSAAPWNKRQVFAHTFIKGGRFPNRKALAMGGQVFVRVGKGRTPIKNVHSGLFIPNEMVTGQSEATFYQIVERDLPDRIVHEVMRAL